VKCEEHAGSRIITVSIIIIFRYFSTQFNGRTSVLFITKDVVLLIHMMMRNGGKLTIEGNPPQFWHKHE
jgi:hypothetical protein